MTQWFNWETLGSPQKHQSPSPAAFQPIFLVSLSFIYTYSLPFSYSARGTQIPANCQKKKKTTSQNKIQKQHCFVNVVTVYPVSSALFSSFLFPSPFHFATLPHYFTSETGLNSLWQRTVFCLFNLTVECDSMLLEQYILFTGEKTDRRYRK